MIIYKIKVILYIINDNLLVPKLLKYYIKKKRKKWSK
jgi:hypothetical protein